MLHHSLHSLLRRTRNGYVVARRIVLGLACCMALVYGAQEISASETVEVEATVQCPDAPSSAQASESAASSIDVPTVRAPLPF